MSELKATHQCTICGARWRELDDFRWNLRSKECGPCCDNVPMGDQIEALEDVAPWSGPLTAEEQGLIDDAWQTHKAATSPPASADALRVAKALAKADGLDWDEVCGVDADPDEGYCDSGTCVAAHWEEHDAEQARRWYMHLATAAMSAISPAWQDIATAPRDGTWILIRGRNAANYPMVPVVCRWSRGVNGHEPITWRDSAGDRDMMSLIYDVPQGSSADWQPLPGDAP